MENQAPYHVSFVVVPPTKLPAPATSLEAAAQALITRLRLTAAAAGLPDFTLSTRAEQRTQGLSWASYSLLAAKPSTEWHNAQVAVEASTLDEAEIKFLEALAEYAFHQLDLVHEVEPRLFGNQQLASYAALLQEAA